MDPRNSHEKKLQTHDDIRATEFSTLLRWLHWFPGPSAANDKENYCRCLIRFYRCLLQENLFVTAAQDFLHYALNMWTREALYRLYSLSPLFFIKFLFFHQMIALQKRFEKCFSFHLKSFFHSWDIQIFVIFPLPFYTFEIQKNKWKWNNLWCHELACINLQVQVLE